LKQLERGMIMGKELLHEGPIAVETLNSIREELDKLGRAVKESGLDHVGNDILHQAGRAHGLLTLLNRAYRIDQALVDSMNIVDQD